MSDVQPEHGRWSGAASWKRPAGLLVAALWLLAAVGPAGAQPDPRQMSGIPLPDPQLPAGTITVRVVRGQLSNNVSGHPVELRQGDNVVTVMTDAEGRAEFLTLNPGTTVVAATTLDGVELDSQPFAVPGRGGIRLMLVGAGDATDDDVPAEPGPVHFGVDSRIVIELGEETVSVFYLFDVVNERDVPVVPEHPVTLILPPGAVSTTVLRDSDPRTRAEGPRVTLPGPFPVGATPFRIAYVLPYSGDRTAVVQPLPIGLEALLLIVQKWGDMDVASSQIARRADMAPDGPDGGTYIFAAGPPIAAGSTVSFEVTGLPHHSRLPALLTLAVALGMLTIGGWASVTGAEAPDGAERRRRLETRREKRFADLVRLERQRHAGTIGEAKYGARRRELIAGLERIYAELDEEIGPVLVSTGRPTPGPKTSPITGPSGSAG